MTIGYTIITQAGRKCAWCDKAAELLDSKGVAYNMRPLAMTDLQEAARAANMNTVPIIYHGVKLIGGYDALTKYLGENT